MSVVTFSCPECGKVLKSSKGTPAGKKIKCPTCAAVFPMPDHDDEELAAGVSTRPRPVGAAARHTDDDDDDSPRRRRTDDDDEDGDRPRRKKKAAGKKRGGLALLLVGAGAVVLLFLVGAGAGIYYLLYAGTNRGNGNEEPLAFVPAGTEVIVNVDFATLLSDPALGPTFEKMMRDEAKSGDFFESCKKDTGLEFKELAARMVICTDLDTLNQGGLAGNAPAAPPAPAGKAAGAGRAPVVGAIGGLPKGVTLICRTSRPFDQKKVAGSCKNPVRKSAHGKYYYEVNEGDMRTMFMPSDRTLILSTLPSSDLDTLFASDGSTPSVSGDAAALCRSVSATTYSVAIPFQGEVRSKLDNGVRQGKGNNLDPMQPIMEQVAKGKGVAAWGTLDGQQVKLGVDVLYADAASASAMAQSADKSWGAQKLALAIGLGIIKAQMPKIVQLLSELTQSLKFTGEGTTARATASVGRATLGDAIVEGQAMQRNGGPFGGFGPGAGFGPPAGIPNPGGIPMPPGGKPRSR